MTDETEGWTEAERAEWSSEEWTSAVSPGNVTLTDAARAVAARRAAEDRDLLARLILEGRVERRSPGHYADLGNRRAARAFQGEVEELVKPKVNLAIRPSKKRRR